MNGEIENDELEYHILGIGGATISLLFDEYSSSTSMELKILQLMYNEHLHIHDRSLTKWNLLCYLSCKSKDTRSALIKQLLEEFHSDHHQVYHLTVITKHLNSQDLEPIKASNPMRIMIVDTM